MNAMRQSLAVLAAAAALLIAPAGFAATDEHVAPASAVEARLAESAAQRTADLAAVDSVLATPLAREAASSVGADIERLRAGVPALSDAELRDLAARASALQADPVAGMDRQMRMLIMIGLILVIIILLLAILD
jgi:hypothetical protein